MKIIWRRELAWIAIVLILVISAGCPEKAQAERSEIEDTSINVQGYTMEVFLSQPEKIENELVAIEGYAKFEQNGMILYYTKNDYLYDTKENAVWLPERGDLSIEEYFQDELIYKGEKGLVNGNFYSVRGIVQKQESPYAAVAVYCRINYDVWNRANPSPKTVKMYGEPTEQEAERVSIYRLLADPWSYDGKKIRIEGYSYQESSPICPNTENSHSTIKWASEMYGHPTEWKMAYADIVDKYSQMEKYKKVPSDNLRLLLESAIYSTKARLNIEMMFYMHHIENYLLEETGVSYVYWPRRITIQEKDIEKCESYMNAYAQMYCEEEG